MADPSNPPPLADLLEPRGEIEAGNSDDTDFRLSIAIDTLRERALMLRVVVILEVIVALVIAREAFVLFVLDT